MKTNFPFRWKDRRLKCLGMYLAPTLEKLYAVNFPQFLTSLMDEFGRRGKMSHSWFGSNIIKIMTFLRLLYLLQTLPIVIPNKILKQIRRLFPVIENP